MFNFWSELERFIQNSYNYNHVERETLVFEAFNGEMRIPYKIAQYIHDDWKDWSIRESDFVEHLDKLEDYNRLLRNENRQLRLDMEEMNSDEK